MTSWKDDPEWQAARQDLVADDENPDRRLVRSIYAALRLYEIESGQSVRELDPGKVLLPGRGIVWKQGTEA